MTSRTTEDDWQPLLVAAEDSEANDDEYPRHAVWDGTTKGERLFEKHLLRLNLLADAADRGDWLQMLTLLDDSWYSPNDRRPGDAARDTLLHRAARGGAPITIVEQLIAMGAWRTIRNAKGQRPVDLALQSQHLHLFGILEPEIRHPVPADTLAALQARFHEQIMDIADDLIEEGELLMPELEILTELDPPCMTFPISGMYGGFRYWLDTTGETITLEAESRSRICTGSKTRYSITTNGCKAWSVED